MLKINKSKSFLRILPYFVATLSMIFFGVSYIWTKVLLKTYGPLTIIVLRLLLSSLMLGSYLFCSRKINLKKGHLKYFMVLAFFEPFLYFIGENFGMMYVSPTVASMIIATIPLITPIIVLRFVKERLSLYNIIGLIVSFTGVMTVLLTKNSTLEYSFKGIALLFFSVFATIGYSIVVKKLTGQYSSVNIVFFQNFIGFFYFVPLFLIFEWKDFLLAEADFETYSALLQLSFFASTLAFILFTKSIREIGIARTNVFANLIPVVTAVFSFIILKNILSAQEIVGILIVIIGLFLSQKRVGKSRIRRV